MTAIKNNAVAVLATAIVNDYNAFTDQKLIWINEIVFCHIARKNQGFLMALE